MGTRSLRGRMASHVSRPNTTPTIGSWNIRNPAHRGAGSTVDATGRGTKSRRRGRRGLTGIQSPAKGGGGLQMKWVVGLSPRGRSR